MFGFKERNSAQESKSPEIAIKESLQKIVSLIDAGNVGGAIGQIVACNEAIQKLAPIQQSKISMYWTGGVMGMANMLFSMPEHMLQMQANFMMPQIRTHVLNTLNALS